MVPLMIIIHVAIKRLDTITMANEATDGEQVVIQPAEVDLMIDEAVAVMINEMIIEIKRI